MKQGHLIKFILFVAALGGYLYLFDKSFGLFVESAIKVSELDFSDKFLLNTIIWLIGFWGILVYLNISHRSARITMWCIFIAATFINFVYHESNGMNLNVAGIDKVEDALYFWHDLSAVSITKFLVFSSAIIGLALFIGPLSIGIVSWFPWALISISFIVVLFIGKGVALQSAYTVPAILIYKLLGTSFHYIAEQL